LLQAKNVKWCRLIWSALHIYQGCRAVTFALARLSCMTGRQLTSFNRPSRVHVGAKRDSMDNIVRPFRGKITGQFVVSTTHNNVWLIRVNNFKQLT